MSGPPPQRSTGSASKEALVEALNISLGVEFEFLVLRPIPKDYKASRGTKEYYKNGLELVSPVLEKPMQLPCSSCPYHHSVILPVHLQKSTDLLCDHKYWNVVTDESVKLAHRDNVDLVDAEGHFYAVEVTSRVLLADGKGQAMPRETETRHVPSATYKDEISAVLDSLHKAFSFPDTSTSHPGEHLAVNKTCAFHVRIGNGSSGFPLRTLKNILCIYTAFERLIDSMHAASRIGGTTLALEPLFAEAMKDPNDKVNQSPIDGNIYNMPLTAHLISSAYVTRRNKDLTHKHAPDRKRYPGPQIISNRAFTEVAKGFDTMSFIEPGRAGLNGVEAEKSGINEVEAKETDINEAEKKKTGIDEVEAKKTDINLLNLSYPADPKKTNTIEFRQHAAVTSPDEALPWIEFVQTLVRYAYSHSAADINSACERAASDPHLSLKDMFDLLGVSAETQAYYINRASDSAADAAQPAVTPTEVTQAAVTPLQAVVQRLAAKCKEAYWPEKVVKAVRNKFKGAVTGNLVDSLVIGYQAVEPKWEDSEDMEEADELNELEGLDELEETPDNGEEEEAREAKRLKSDEDA